MANGKRIMRLTAILVVLAGVLGFQMEAMGMLGSAADDAKGQPDVIMIDTIARLGELEQSAAVFFHDTHSKALKKQGLSCDSCHKTDEKGTMSLKFARLEGEGQPELSATELKDIYHDNCITCHTATAEKNLKTGPMVGECRSCHQEKPEVVADRARAGMDNVLHFAHWNSKEIPADMSEKTNCGSCHHAYDKTAKKLIYTKGEEETCRTCHTETPAEPVTLDTKEAFHNQCVTCHQKLVLKKAEKTGPVECAGCHGEVEQTAIKAKGAKMVRELGGELPRLPRKQPDAVLMMPKRSENAPAPEKAVGMAPVAFNHKFHEGVVDTCSACHAKGVTVPMDMSFEAMHDAQNDQSCIGCHAKEQQKPECAGCHSMRSEIKAPSDASCMVCHQTPKSEDIMLMATATPEAKVAEAMSLIASRPETQQIPALDAIPEFVTIDVMSDKYQPSKMPHRKIVLSMVEKMKGSELAATFHATPEALCAGCHHNSPASVTPPKCASCHAKPFADPTSGKPGLKAAYHGQCMGCHTEMKLEKPAATNCVACHEKKNNG